jgi:hypothetical protein
MNYRRIINNPFVLFLPFLIAFIAYAVISPTNGASGDEGRYLQYAKNLIHGFYSPPSPNIELTNGPGYPIILIPFILFRLPLICITLLNAIFYYLSIVLLYKALNLIVSLQNTRIFSLIWACYYIGYQSIPFIHTETFTYFLISALAFAMIRAFQDDQQKVFNKYILMSGFLIGFIVLTKMIFGYVLLILLIGSGFLWVLKRSNLICKKGLIMVLIAFATTLPYLVYTYQLTGRMFFWGTGNDSLYWMSNPDANEYGSWFPDQTMDKDTVFFSYYIAGCRDTIKAHHGKELAEIHKLKGLAKDDAYRNVALKNIKAHPVKYIQNIVYNSGRLLFQYPFSYGIHRPKILIVFPINGIILTFILFSLIPTLVNWKKIFYPIRFMLIFVLIYLGGSVTVVAYVRMFAIIVPILLIWIAFIFQNTINIQLKFGKVLQPK